jgi:pyruvate/2-oxoacid:ferredoxin oxidoreductase beta subunit
VSKFLKTTSFPYCKGCGHHLVARNTVRALEALNLEPLDVVLVTDIGCQGIVDRAFATHTIHGLHGRSVALGSGIAAGLPPNKNKKVIVYIGDGGATIGLQHLLEAARLNIDLTVVLHNNMLYGMTGGQPSGLTPCGFRTVITQQGNPYPHHDLCKLVHEAGAPYTQRVLGQGNFSAAIQTALEIEGFALVEVLELCTGHALKMNPDLRLREMAQEVGYEPEALVGEQRSPLRLQPQSAPPDLLAGHQIKTVEPQFQASLKDRKSLVLSGSAGEGVQKAAEIFARAAISSGLHATKKGRYPVTVGVGFSTAEVIIARDPIAYHGISQPDVVIATSTDGLAQEKTRIEAMRTGALWLDESLDPPATGAALHRRDFRGQAGPRNAALYSLLTFAQETNIIPPEAIVSSIRASSIAQYVPQQILAPFTARH